MSDTNTNLSRRVLFRNAALAVGVLGSSALIAGCQPQTGAQAQPAPPPAPPGAFRDHVGSRNLFLVAPFHTAVLA